MTKQARAYTASDIRTFEGPKAVRKRPGMYVGVGEPALCQMGYEIVSNGVDEAIGGHATLITVRITKDGMFIVSDDGRGIPYKNVTVGSKKVPACIQAATSLHAGGKFDTNAYAVSGGTNGVGLTSVNALSTHFRLETHREGFAHFFECEKGEIVTPLTKIGKSKKTGTIVEFKPDPSVLEVVDFPEKRIREMCKNAAYLNSGLKVVFQPAQGKKEVFQFEDGPAQFVMDHAEVAVNDGARVIFKPPFAINGSDGNVEVHTAFTWTTSGNEEIHSFVNGVRTPMGGTHETGFRLALTQRLKAFVEGGDFLKGKDKKVKVDGVDTREGIVAIVSVRLPEPKFHSQTKDRLGSLEAQGATQKLTHEFLKDLLQRDRDIAKALALRVVAAARSRVAAKRAREMTRKDVLGDNLGLPAKLKDCISTNADECELFLVEGNSAGGSAEVGRDSKTQAILFLRGKVLNTHNRDLANVLKNEEIRSILSALGTGIGPEFDIEKLRYNKVILMTDADVDGSHIVCLLLTLFYKHLPQLIQRGHVYVAQPPLFQLKKGPKIVGYFHGDTERDRWIMDKVEESYDVDAGTTLTNIPDEVIAECTRGFSFGYLKGLGEMNPDELAETTMRPNDRALVRVDIDDAEEAFNAFRVLMDNRAVEDRKEFISENALDASLDV